MNNMLNIPRHTNCTNCGECCGMIPASEREVAVIRDYIAKNKISPVNKENPGKCPFRDERRKRCLVYPVRPVICRLYGVAKGSMRCPNGNSADIDGKAFLPKSGVKILNFEKW